jgi:hypothetical protein
VLDSAPAVHPFADLVDIGDVTANPERQTIG